MELKLSYCLDNIMKFSCLNCTVMELKPYIDMFLLLECIRLNCTVMELKPPTGGWSLAYSLVLIVPLWN